MENVVALAIELGYLDIPAGTLVDLKMTKNIPDDKLVIITTGSQGEPMSALSRIASGEHRSVKLKKGDTVILSSTPVPGNEKTVSNVVNKLFEKGAEVIYSDIADIHVSGHACQEELKLMHSLLKPKFFMPVHGEYRHLIQHARLAEGLGMDMDHIFVLENGDILKISTSANKEHFDGFVHRHFHFVCNKCDKIYDVDLDGMDEIKNQAAEKLNADIEDYSLIFYGICENCSSKKNN